MVASESSIEVYRLHVWIRQISPMIWRLLLVRGDSTIADLHYTIQIAFGWSDEHLNRFHIHGQDYGVYHDGGISFSTDPNQVQLCDFGFRTNERFLYEYDFTDIWRHEVRVEARLAKESKRVYPCCIGGQRQAPPEDCGGSLAFMAKRDNAPLQVNDLMEEIRNYLEDDDMEAISDLVEYMEELQEWLDLDSFDRRTANRRLKQYAANDETWMWR
jgi:predicted house-cleaning noncanonical NTP pyrophosphatase (MazG superfamily)